LWIFNGNASFLVLGALAFITFLYPSLEWTGFFFNSGLFFALCYHGVTNRSKSIFFLSAAITAVNTVFAGIIILFQFTSALGVDEFFVTSMHRASARAFNLFSLIELPFGYFVSFAALIPISIFSFLYLLSCKPMHERLKASGFYLVLFIASFSMVENLALMQHAAEFSFDRLKLAVPLLLVCSAAYAISPLTESRLKKIFGISAIVIWSNLSVFSHDLSYYQPWGTFRAANARLVNKLSNDPVLPCSVFGTNTQVRGYINLVLRHDIHEGTTPAGLIGFLKRDNYCGAVYLRSRSTDYRDLPEFLAIEVYDDAGNLVRRYEDNELD